jgi:signal peptidase I
MLRVARVGGRSMSPMLQDGDFIVAVRSGWADRYRRGDVVLVDHAALGWIVKRIARIDAEGWLRLEGDDPASCSSESIGRVPSQAVLGRAVLRIAPPPRGTSRLRRAED